MNLLLDTHTLLWPAAEPNKLSPEAAATISNTHSLALSHRPEIHKDPFDRILVAQAETEGFLLLTSDEFVGRYPGPVRLV